MKAISPLLNLSVPGLLWEHRQIVFCFLLHVDFEPFYRSTVIRGCFADVFRGFMKSSPAVMFCEPSLYAGFTRPSS